VEPEGRDGSGVVCSGAEADGTADCVDAPGVDTPVADTLGAAAEDSAVGEACRFRAMKKIAANTNTAAVEMMIRVTELDRVGRFGRRLADIPLSGSADGAAEMAAEPGGPPCGSDAAGVALSDSSPLGRTSLVLMVPEGILSVRTGFSGSVFGEVELTGTWGLAAREAIGGGT
jgi:hypothetical protein